MNRDQFIQALGRLQSLELVKAYHDEGPAKCILEMYPNIDKKNRTQLVKVQLTDDSKFVIAFSFIGACPSEPVILNKLLKENLDGCYSRIAIMGDDLVQIYRYPLEELELVEMLKGIDETSRYADHYETKYFDGVDNA